jgi:hypothetical protein
MRAPRSSKNESCVSAEEMGGGFRAKGFDLLVPSSFFFTVLPDEPFLMRVCLGFFFLSPLEVDFLDRLDC